MSRLQEGDQEGERKLKVRKQLIDDSSSSVGTVYNEDVSYGQFKRPPFEGLSRTTIKIDDVPQPQYTEAPSVTNPLDHAPPIGSYSPTKSDLQEGEQEGEGFPGQGKKIGPLQEGEDEASEGEEEPEDTKKAKLRGHPSKRGF
jgi:hypothetical protein